MALTSRVWLTGALMHFHASGVKQPLLAHVLPYDAEWTTSLRDDADFTYLRQVHAVGPSGKVHTPRGGDAPVAVVPEAGDDQDTACGRPRAPDARVNGHQVRFFSPTPKSLLSLLLLCAWPKRVSKTPSAFGWSPDDELLLR